MNIRCDDCTFFGHDNTARKNVCKRHSPIVVGGPSGEYTAWPEIDPEDRCGDFVDAGEYNDKS